MAQLAALLEERGLVEVDADEYRLTEDGVRVGHMLAMVEGGELPPLTTGGAGPGHGARTAPRQT
jgi:hypothetical protein